MAPCFVHTITRIPLRIIKEAETILLLGNASIKRSDGAEIKV